MGISNGKVIMYKGHVCGRGGRFITTPAGKASVEAAGVEPLVVDPKTTPFLERPCFCGFYLIGRRSPLVMIFVNAHKH